MAVSGFNVGSTISLCDMSLAIDYLQNKDIFENELQEIKEKLTLKKKEEDREKKKFEAY